MPALMVICLFLSMAPMALAVDNTPPVTELVIGEPQMNKTIDGVNYTYVTASTPFNITAEDNESAVKEIWFRVWSPEQSDGGDGPGPATMAIIPAWWSEWELYTDNFTLDRDFERTVEVFNSTTNLTVTIIETATLFDGLHFIEYFAMNNDSINSTVQNKTFVLDKFGPMSVLMISNYINGINQENSYDNQTFYGNPDTILCFNITDMNDYFGFPGIGEEFVFYRYNHDDEWTNWINYTVPFHLTDEGRYTFEFYGLDHFNQSEPPIQVTIEIFDTDPQVTSTLPIDGITELILNPDITLTFNVPMQSFDDSISIFPEITNFTYQHDPINDDGKTLVVTGFEGLEYSTTYLINISTNATDFTGRHISERYTFTFTTMMDTDGDNWPDILDDDDDNDGVEDVNDTYPLDPTEQFDSDGDGLGDNTDTDDDDDGAPDIHDAFPTDPDEQLDTDKDGIGNNVDTDDDGDGVPDVDDAFPLDKSETIDTDGDGVGNNADTDDDNDGFMDLVDPEPLNSKVGRSEIGSYMLWVYLGILVMMVILGAGLLIHGPYKS